MRINSPAARIVAAALCASACGDAASRDTSQSPPASESEAPGASSTPSGAELTLQDEDWSKPWRQLVAPSFSVLGAQITGAPGGWIAKAISDGALSGVPLFVSVAYFSPDGTHWHAVPTGTEPPMGSDISYSTALRGASLAAGGGHYVITGTRGGTSIVLSSTTGKEWSEQQLADVVVDTSPRPVQYDRDRFFYVRGALWSSTDAGHWAVLPGSDAYRPLRWIAYGNGRYFALGDDTLLSLDGVNWRKLPIDCAMLNACYTDAEGHAVEQVFEGVFFAQGQFHARVHQFPSGEFSSPDGESWQYVPDFAPDAYVGGRFARFLNGQPAVWLTGDDTPRPIDVVSFPRTTQAQFQDLPPADVDLSWQDGLDCTNSRCILVHSQLYLLP